MQVSLLKPSTLSLVLLVEFLFPKPRPLEIFIGLNHIATYSTVQKRQAGVEKMLR